jgi:hypothetical protein
VLRDLLAKGYFPRELPEPFNTTSYGDAISSNISNLPNLFHNGGHVTNPSVHNSARPGTLRRKLSVPNPVNMFRLSNLIEQNWSNIEQHVSQSTVSMTTPSVGGSERAIDRKHALNQLPELIVFTHLFIHTVYLGHFIPNLLQKMTQVMLFLVTH